MDDWEAAHRQLAGLDLHGENKPVLDNKQSRKKRKEADDTNLEEEEVSWYFLYIDNEEWFQIKYVNRETHVRDCTRVFQSGFWDLYNCSNFGANSFIGGTNIQEWSSHHTLVKWVLEHTKIANFLGLMSVKMH